VLLQGTEIGGVPVGGLRADEAVRVLRDRLEAPLHRTITVSQDRFHATTSAWDLGRRVDVATAVRRAMHRNHEGALVTRVWRHMFGHEQRSLAVTPRWVTTQPVTALLARAARQVFVAPQNARLETPGGWVSVVPEKTGVDLDQEQSKAAVIRAAETGTTPVALVTKVSQPEVHASAFSKVILVHTGENKLFLYQDGQIVKTYNVATGQAAFPTPTGIFKVVTKLANPTWTNPGSDWARSMPHQIGPGPNNPLGTKALALSASGILIHASPDRTSIGFSASHGCIRMLEEDEADLFSQVSPNTPVAIVNAGPPKPRTRVQAPPPDPNQAAAVQY
jgi:lipoprotein-anchoring transpeptidase ErfK/SrfK